MDQVHFDFFGGLHIDDHKRESNQHPIITVALPNLLTIPLQQHVGATCLPLVKVGDHVLKGQLIGYSGHDISSGIHASTSGDIKNIGIMDIPHPSEQQVPCIVLEPDGEDRACKPQPLVNWKETSLSLIQEHLQKMGIAGLGGGVFPSHVKLSEKIHTLVINGAECEPYITCDDLLMRESAELILKGAHVTAQIVKADKILFGIEDNKPQSIEALHTAKEKLNSDIDIIVIPTKYPSGGAKQLIKCLTNVSIPIGHRTTRYGFQCFNVATVIAIYEALIEGRPLIERVVTVSGNTGRGQNYRVRLGTQIIHLLQYHEQRKYDNVIIGGPLMGYPITKLHSPVTKSTNCLLLPFDSWKSNQEEMPCIRCGACIDVCPASLQPHLLYWFSKGNQLEKAEEHYLFDCIECGCCSYVCPSHIPLVQYYRYAKDSIREEKALKKQTQESKVRFESRQERQKRAEEEKAKRFAEHLKNRQQKSQEEKDAIQAALNKVNNNETLGVDNLNKDT